MFSFFRIPTLIAVTVCFTLLDGCYLWKQGICMFTYTLGATPVSRVARRPDTPDSLRRFFSLVNDIRAFAVDSVGLKKTSNYTTYVTINKGYLLTMVSATGAADFTPYTWCYPLFGCWPLRSYFDKADADSEAARLSRKGYDVSEGPVDGFSTLGILSDPLYSFMRHFSVYQIANLIIHEQTHATLYVKNQVDFDEELACFNGSEGALRFIRSRYGDTSTEYAASVNFSADLATYNRVMRVLYTRLADVYKSDLPRAEKLRHKQTIISRFRDSISTHYDSIFRTPSFRGIQKAPINNASLATDMTYGLNLGLFYRLYAIKHRDFHAVMRTVESFAKTNGDCMARVKEFVEKQR